MAGSSEAIVFSDFVTVHEASEKLSELASLPQQPFFLVCVFVREANYSAEPLALSELESESEKSLNVSLALGITHFLFVGFFFFFTKCPKISVRFFTRASVRGAFASVSGPLSNLAHPVQV